LHGPPSFVRVALRPNVWSGVLPAVFVPPRRPSSPPRTFFGSFPGRNFNALSQMIFPGQPTFQMTMKPPSLLIPLERCALLPPSFVPLFIPWRFRLTPVVFACSFPLLGLQEAPEIPTASFYVCGAEPSDFFSPFLLLSYFRSFAKTSPRWCRPASPPLPQTCVGKPEEESSFGLRDGLLSVGWSHVFC